MSPIAKAVDKLCHRHQRWKVWADFVAMAAYSLSNAVDLKHREEREARYMQIVKCYTPEEVAEFPRMMAELALALEKDPSDYLGAAFGELELANKWHGQFFTPQHLANLCGLIALDGAAEIIEREGFITLSEPAVGAGAMVIGACRAMKQKGYNYQRQMHATCVDVSDTAAHMAYIQLSLLNVPAIVHVGNSLSMEMREIWYTPAHILGLWSAKLARKSAATQPAVTASVGEAEPKAAPLRPDFTLVPPPSREVETA